MAKRFLELPHGIPSDDTYRCMFAALDAKHFQNCFEDDCRIRTGNGAGNFSELRHIALNQLKRKTSTRRSLKGKRKKPAWDEQCLLKLLTG